MKKQAAEPKFPGGIKTLEFKLRLSPTKQKTLEGWMYGCRFLWNLSLSYWEEAQQRYYREAYPVEGDAITAVWHKHPNSESPSLKKLPLSDRLFIACPLPIDAEGNPTSSKYRPHYGCADPIDMARKVASTVNTPDYPVLKGIYSMFKTCVVQTLEETWVKYLQGKNRKPKYKGAKHPVTTLKAKLEFKVIGDRIKIPNLGWVSVKGLEKRWTNHPKRTSPIRTVQITKKASGWYLQLSGYFLIDSSPAKKPDVAIGLDPGVSALLTRDDGWKAENPRFLKESEAELKRLQKKLARQTPGSNRQALTKQKIAKLHEKIARQRKSHHHQISTHLVDVYGAIAIEENTLRNMTRRPKPVKKSQGEGYEHNGAAAKSGLNKSLLDAGTGMLRDMIKSKATSRGREFHLVSVRGNKPTQTCPQCGHQEPKPLSQRVHHCKQCGFTADRDQAAAMVVRQVAPWSREYKTEVTSSTQPQQVLPQEQQVQAPVDSQDQPAISLQLVLPLV